MAGDNVLGTKLLSLKGDKTFQATPREQDIYTS